MLKIQHLATTKSMLTTGKEWSFWSWGWDVKSVGVGSAVCRSITAFRKPKIRSSLQMRWVGLTSCPRVRVRLNLNKRDNPQVRWGIASMSCQWVRHCNSTKSNFLLIKTFRSRDECFGYLKTTSPQEGFRRSFKSTLLWPLSLQVASGAAGGNGQGLHLYLAWVNIVWALPLLFTRPHKFQHVHIFAKLILTCQELKWAYPTAPANRHLSRVAGPALGGCCSLTSLRSLPPFAPLQQPTSKKRGLLLNLFNPPPHLILATAVVLVSLTFRQKHICIIHYPLSPPFNKTFHI